MGLSSLSRLSSEQAADLAVDFPRTADVNLRHRVDRQQEDIAFVVGEFDDVVRVGEQAVYEVDAGGRGSDVRWEIAVLVGAGLVDTQVVEYKYIRAPGAVFADDFQLGLERAPDLLIRFGVVIPEAAVGSGIMSVEPEKNIRVDAGQHAIEHGGALAAENSDVLVGGKPLDVCVEELVNDLDREYIFKPDIDRALHSAATKGAGFEIVMLAITG